jgi:hypothetical protein
MLFLRILFLLENFKIGQFMRHMILNNCQSSLLSLKRKFLAGPNMLLNIMSFVFGNFIQYFICKNFLKLHLSLIFLYAIEKSS